MITIKNLSKRYENLTVVDNLNLTIDENEVFGLLGPNGVGKLRQFIFWLLYSNLLQVPP